MNNRILITAVLLLNLGSSYAGLFNSVFQECEGFVREYSKLNDWLLRNVPSYDAPTNVAEAKKYFLNPANKASKRMVEAVKLFASLEELDENKCTQVALATMENNVAASDDHALEQEPSRRIDQVIHHYLVKHAEDCKEWYPHKVAAALRVEREVYADYVMNFVEDYIYDFVDAYPTGWRNLESNLRGQDVAEMMTDFVSARPIGASDIKAGFKAYIEEPCDKFQRLLGPFLATCYYDARVVRNEYDKVDDKRFLVAFGGYNWCELVKHAGESLLERE